MTSYLEPLFSTDLVLQLNYENLSNYLMQKYKLQPLFKLHDLKMVQPTIYWIPDVNIGRALINSIVDSLTKKLSKQYNTYTAIIDDNDMLYMSLIHPTAIALELRSIIQNLQENFYKEKLHIVKANTIRVNYGLRWQALDIMLNYWVEISSLTFSSELSEFYEYCERNAKQLYLFNKFGLDLHIATKYQFAAVEKLKYFLPKLKVAKKFFDELSISSKLAEPFALFVTLWNLNRCYGLPIKLVLKDTHLQKMLGIELKQIESLAQFLQRFKEVLNSPYIVQYIKQHRRFLLEQTYN